MRITHAKTRCRRLAGAAAAALALALAGCGEEGTGDPAQLAPANAAAWVEATIDPKGDQEKAVRAILNRFPRGNEVPQLIAREIEQEARSGREPVDFERDVRPWLGERAGAFVIPGDEAQGGLVVAAKDEGKAQELIDKTARDDQPTKRSHKGVDYTVTREGAAGVVEGFLVASDDEQAVKAGIDAVQGSSLADSGRYTQAVGRLPGDRIATAFVDIGALIDAGADNRREADAAKRLFGPAAQEPLVASMRAEPDAVSVDWAVQGGGALGAVLIGTGSGLLPSLPSDSWLAVGQDDLGGALKGFFGRLGALPGVRGEVGARQLERLLGLDLDRDLVAWMGNAGIFFRGTTIADLGGGFVVESKDPRASRRALAKAARAVRRLAEGARVTPSTLTDVDAGFTVRPREVPIEVHAAQRGRRVVVALGERAAEDALGPASALGGAAAFKQAAESLGDGYSPSTYVAFQPILAAAETGGANQPGFRRALPYLEKLRYLVGGTKRDGDALLARLRLELAK